MLRFAGLPRLASIRWNCAGRFFVLKVAWKPDQIIDAPLFVGGVNNFLTGALDHG